MQPVAVALEGLDGLGAADGVGEALAHASCAGCAGPRSPARILARPTRLDARDGAGLDGDEPLEDAVGVVLVGEEHGAAVRGDGVAQHLQRHRGLAQALRTAEEHELAGAEPAGQGDVERVEAGRPDPGPGRLARCGASRRSRRARRRASAAAPTLREWEAKSDRAAGDVEPWSPAIGQECRHGPSDWSCDAIATDADGLAVGTGLAGRSRPNG